MALSKLSKLSPREEMYILQSTRVDSEMDIW